MCVRSVMNQVHQIVYWFDGQEHLQARVGRFADAGVDTQLAAIWREGTNLAQLEAFSLPEPIIKVGKFASSLIFVELDILGALRGFEMVTGQPGSRISHQ